ncbi:MAG: hypothetical protein HYV16_01465 [Gammaproteobacteria bacterium]|nr:hypothetical protein [Gammaproteobacteria bacterium]
MKNWKTGLFFALASLFLQPAQATVIDFEDFDIGVASGTIPVQYAGFDWGNFRVIHDQKNIGTGYDNGTLGNYSAFNWYAAVGTVEGNLFDFNGAYFTAAWNNGLHILIEGLLDGVTVMSQEIVVDTTGPTWFNLNFLGINGLRFSSFGGVDMGLGGSGTHFVMDNFTINQVPEPLGVALFSLGLIPLLRRRVARR